MSSLGYFHGAMGFDIAKIGFGNIGGRLSLASGTPVTIADQIGAMQVFFTPYRGNNVPIHDGAQFIKTEFGELSVPVPSTTDTPFDIFVREGATGPELTTLDWASDSARATPVTLQDGIYVNSAALAETYLGTGRTTTTAGETEDSELRRLLWNNFNRVPRRMFIQAGANWTQTGGSWIPWDNDTTNQVNFVLGLNEEPVIFDFRMASNATATTGTFPGIGIDSSTLPFLTDGMVQGPFGMTGTITNTASAFVSTELAPGYHFAVMMVIAIGAVSYWGGIFSGLTGYVRG